MAGLTTEQGQGEVVRPTAIIIPSVTTAIRNTMIAEPGTIIFDSTQSKLCFCKAAVAAAASWEKITSVQEA
jgi:hypothetical protein